MSPQGFFKNSFLLYTALLYGLKWFYSTIINFFQENLTTSHILGIGKSL